MKPLGNGLAARSTRRRSGRYTYTVSAWVDAFLSWRHYFARRIDPDDLRIAAHVGAELIDAAAERAGGADAGRLRKWAETLRWLGEPLPLKQAGGDDHAAIMNRHPDRHLATTFPVEQSLFVDRECAHASRAGTSCSRGRAAPPTGAPARYVRRLHCTASDVAAWLPMCSPAPAMIHPIGRVRRKGPNNTLEGGADDVGDTVGDRCAKAVTRRSTRRWGRSNRSVARRGKRGKPARACARHRVSAPDHPYVKEHPQWFRHRPDGSIQYAENPPKKYQDIYPFDFECDDWQALWEELKSVFVFWIEHGLRIFRVDNPHTKPFPFWEWCIAQVKQVRPDAMFLSEAFTRPKIMYRLAKLGFTQSYTYFTWRNTKQELTEYFTELSQPRRPMCFDRTGGRTHRISSRLFAERRPTGVFMARMSGRHALGELGHLRAGVRAAGA